MSFYAGTPTEAAHVAPAQGRARTLARLALLAAALILGGLTVARVEHPRSTVARVRPTTMRELGQLPLAQRAQMSSAAGAASASFAVRTGAAGTLRATGRGIDSIFDTAGVTIRNAHADIRLSGLSLDGEPVLPSARPQAFGNRVTYRGSSIAQWYANGPLGLEQGFTVARAPAAGQQLSIGFAARGTRLGRRRGGEISLGGGLIYGGLSATGADGRRLPARMELDGQRIVLVVDTAGARFPVQVDPLVLQEKLSSGTGTGSSLAISENGDTALVGGIGEEPGTVDVFVRSGTVWTLQQKLSPGGPDAHEFGEAGSRRGDHVALSGEGNTAMIVGYTSQHFAHIWTYTRSGGVWTPQSKTLEEEDGNDEARESFGEALALSYNGETAVVSEPFGGVVFVLHRTSSGWKEATSFPAPTEVPDEADWGYGVAIAGDGKVLAVAAPGEAVREVFFYSEESGVWHLHNSFEYPDYDGEGPVALALDKEGDTALVGEYLGEEGLGAARVYSRSGTSWSLQQSLKRTGAGSEAEEFGIEVGLSERGDRAIVQGYGGNLSKELEGPFIWEYTRSGSTWTQQGTALEVKGSFNGESAFSGDGHTMLLTTEIGTAPYVYVNDATVGAGQASEVTTTSALLSAEVNPAGEAVSSCEFEYGTTTAYGSSAACSPKPEAQTTPVAVSASLKSLSTSTTYHFRVAVTTAAGIIYDSDGTFTTFASSATASTESPSKPATAKVGALTAVAGGGTGSVTVATYGSNPGSAPLPGSTGGYADLYHSNGATFKEVEFTDCEVGDARALWFYGSDGWLPARPAATFSEGCGHFTATSTSRPSVTELVGLKSKWGEPPGEYGECHPGTEKIYIYSESKCLKVAESGGKADGKGKDEWYPVPMGCYPLKKGRYSEAQCHTTDETTKGKGAGVYETGTSAFTGTATAPKLAVSGASSIECSSGKAEGELTGPEKGTETLTLSGCSQAGEPCTSAQESTSGTVQTGPLEAISYEEEGKYLLALTGVQLAQFTCGSSSYSLTGAVSGPQTGAVNAMSKKSSVAFASGEGSQLLVLHNGTTEHAATLTMTQSDASTQSLELDSAITTQG